MATLVIFPPPRRELRICDEILARSDEEALRSDWEKVGQDLRTAMAAMEEELD